MAPNSQEPIKTPKKTAAIENALTPASFGP